MNNYITMVGGQSPATATIKNRYQPVAQTDYPNQAFWMQVYPPLENEYRSPLPHTRALCPWSLAAELGEATTPSPRRQNIMETLKKGLKTIRQYGVAARRIVFTEDEATRQISVWVD